MRVWPPTLCALLAVGWAVAGVRGGCWLQPVMHKSLRNVPLFIAFPQGLLWFPCLIANVMARSNCRISIRAW